jgi:uncharacterized membrane protein
VEPWVVAALWVAFAGTHIGMTTSPIRTRLAERFGRWGFRSLHSIVASIAFSALVTGYSMLKDAGPPALGLAAEPLARAPLIAAIVAGVVLMIGALAPRGYWESPFGAYTLEVRGPTGLARITRHPFFAGMVIVAASHMLLSTRLTGTVFFGGFLVLIIAGSIHQAARLRAVQGASYDRYLAETSAVPFLAILAGRQRLVWRELPWVMLALGLGVAVLIGYFHAGILAAYGAPIILAVVGGGWLIELVLYRRETRPASSGAG